MPLYFTFVKYNIEPRPHDGRPETKSHSTLRGELNMEGTRFLPLLGRVLIGLPFLMSGLGKVASYGATTAYIGSVGLPLAPLGWALAVAFEVGGGLLVDVGFRARGGAIGLAAVTSATASFLHNYFAVQNRVSHFP